MGSLLVLRPLQIGLATTELEFRWSPFWMQVHGLPIDKMTRAHGEVIGNRIGRLVEVEAPTTGLLLHRNFLRLRVEVDVFKPLLQGFILHRKDSTGPVGERIKVLYKHEKLSEFCYACGRIGHDNALCKFVSKEEGLNSGYGPEQRTGPTRNLVSLLGQQRRTMPAGQPEVSQPVEHTNGQRVGGVCELDSSAPRELAAYAPVLPDVSQKVGRDATESSPPYDGLPRTPLVIPESSPVLNLPPHGIEEEHGPSDRITMVPQIASNLGLEDIIIRVEELSRSPSPEQYQPNHLLMDISMSQVFKSLSLKRPISEDDCSGQLNPKRCKWESSTGVAAEFRPAEEAKALRITGRKPKAKAVGRKMGRPKKVLMCEVPVQHAKIDELPKLSREVTVNVSPLLDEELCSQVASTFPSSANLSESAMHGGEAILSIPLASAEGNDTLVWHHDVRVAIFVKSGYEAVKSAYSM
ncbi:hypothetical protein LOK49_Contig90G00007 [Camellia lanceoleosa]|nr:hypothetical protein LOK49_Contig90G00007 [Camellia lanceoleosa]